MVLTENNLVELLAVAKKAVLEAGIIIRNTNKSSITIHSKKTENLSLAAQVVTEIDFLCQQAIINILKPSMKKYDIAILSEEMDDDGSRFVKDYFWCIDPLDGTLAFTKEPDGYAVSVALVSKNGSPVIGVVFNPVNNNMYSAIINRGAYKNESVLKIKNTDVFYLIVDEHFTKNSNFELFREKVLRVVKDNNYNKLNIISHGGAVMNVIWTLEHAPACYFKLPKKQVGGGCIWDYAATVCICNEVSALAVNFHNNVLNLNNSETVFMNKDGVFFSSDKTIAKSILQAIS